MSSTFEPTDGQATTASPPPDAAGGASQRQIPTVGVWSWSFVGFTIAMVIVVFVLAALSEIVLPMTFAAVLAICFRPLVGTLQRLRAEAEAWRQASSCSACWLSPWVSSPRRRRASSTRPTRSASWPTRRSTRRPTGPRELGVDKEALEDARAISEEATPAAAEGALTHLVDLFDSVLALASGLILGSLIMYYLLKDGSGFRQAVVEEGRARRSEMTSPASSATPAARSAATARVAASCRAWSRW